MFSKKLFSKNNILRIFLRILFSKNNLFGLDYCLAAAAKSLQSCQTLCNPIDGSPLGSSVPGILQARKNTGVGCHFLLQCMKVKSESEVAQSCLTLRDPMDCSPPGSSVHGIFQARVLKWVAIAFSDCCLTAAAAKSLQSCLTL